MISLNQAAPELGVSLVSIDMKSADDLETAFTQIKDSEVRALLGIAGALTFTVGAEIADRALRANLPFCSSKRRLIPGD